MSIRHAASPARAKLNALAACLAAALMSGSASAGAGRDRPLDAQRFGGVLLGAAHSPLQGVFRDRPAKRAAKTARSAPAEVSATIDVTNCDDVGAGSLRNAIGGASAGDRIDLTHLPHDCSTITLATGAIAVTVPNITIQGPGQDALTIDGDHAGRVFETPYDLSIADVTIARGSNPYGVGGCVFAGDDLHIIRSTISDCSAGSPAAVAGAGGGVATKGALTLVSSFVRDNSVLADMQTVGGGAYAKGAMLLQDSTITGNSTTSASSFALGGGLFALDDMTVTRSNVSGNTASSATGSAFGGGLSAITAVHVSHSRFQNNSATSTSGVAAGGGIFGYGNGDVVVSDASLILGNTAHSAAAFAYGGGIEAGTTDHSGGSIGLFDSLLSGNTASSDCLNCLTIGGGAAAFATIAAVRSTVAANRALSSLQSAGSAAGGGLATYADGIDGGIALDTSTVSGNSAIASNSGIGSGGGIAAIKDSPFVVFNSTVAFNRASTLGGGVIGSADSGVGVTPRLHSSIVANNEAPASGDIAGTETSAGFTIEGSANLVMVSAADITLPADTLTDDPVLLPLAPNGGPTPTHELASCSPAIDFGTNENAYSFDQRGSPYGREHGAGPDIGALEQQPDADRVMRGTFEPLPCQN